jgi:hypothetical protein
VCTSNPHTKRRRRANDPDVMSSVYRAQLLRVMNVLLRVTRVYKPKATVRSSCFKYNGVKTANVNCNTMKWNPQTPLNANKKPSINCSILCPETHIPSCLKWHMILVS